jgi:hypothetical protein
MVSDDLFASIGTAKPAPAFDPMATQKLPPNAEQTQRMPKVGESTQPNAPLDPKWNPEATQQLDAETTQRIDDSIWRLQEAKRILSGVKGS